MIDASFNKNVMYLEEIARKVSETTGDLTLFGRRNFVQYEEVIYHLIFHSLPIKAPKPISENDLVIPVIPYEMELNELILSVHRGERDLGFYAYRDKEKPLKLVRPRELEIILLERTNKALKISCASNTVSSEEKLKNAGYMEKINELRDEIDRNYATER
ncbi:MAG: hypothetical protein ABIF88_01820 [archaeon]